MSIPAPVLRLVALCLALCLAHPCPGCAEQALLIDEQPFQDWAVLCELTAPQGFTGALTQYQYRQPSFGDIAAPVAAAVQAAFASDPLRPLAPGTLSLLLPTCPTLPRQAATGSPSSYDHLLHALQTAGFQPADTPFLCASLADLEACHRRGVLGRLATPEQWLARCDAGTALALTDVLLLCVPEVDGYPIVPMLFSDAAESDAPLYAVVVLRDGEPLCLEVSGTCEVTGAVALGGAAIPWDDAVRRALDHALGLYQPAMAGMARVWEAGFDYPTFWKAHTPAFVLRAEHVQAAWYARSGLLRPCWYVALSLTVQLAGTETLTPQARHSYLPEVLLIACCVDAVTGEVVQ